MYLCVAVFWQGWVPASGQARTAGKPEDVGPAGPGHAVAVELPPRRRGWVTVDRSAEIAEEGPLRAELEALASQRLPVIVLDLTDLDFINSAALSAIVYGHLKCRHHDGRIRLARPKPAVLQVLQRTRLTTLFPVYDSPNEAMAP